MIRPPMSHVAIRPVDVLRRGESETTRDHVAVELPLEVRLNGQAVNPRPFLEARKDVLQVQQIATARFADVRDRG